MEEIGARERPRRFALETSQDAVERELSPEDNPSADDLAVRLYKLEKKRKEVKGRFWRYRRAQRQNRWLLFGLYALALVASVSGLAAKLA